MAEQGLFGIEYTMPFHRAHFRYADWDLRAKSVWGKFDDKEHRKPIRY